MEADTGEEVDTALHAGVTATGSSISTSGSSGAGTGVVVNGNGMDVLLSALANATAGRNLSSAGAGGAVVDLLGGAFGAIGGGRTHASLSPPTTLSPSIPPFVRLGLTAAYTAAYSLLFAFVYAQLWLVLRYRHKRFSYQTSFLFLCLVWAALRAVLFSFYFRDCVTASALGPFAFWLLYCCPVCLQFFTLSLMNLYCAQVFFKAKSKFSPQLLKYKMPLYLLFVFMSLLFLLVNLTCALLVKTTDTQVKTIVLVRVTINDTLFVLCAISLSVCLYKVAKMSLASIYLESKGTSVCQVTLIGIMVVLLYASRACYNLVVLALTDIESINSFDYDWYNVSDQADLRSTLGDAGYIVFGVILFVWELLPTSLVVFFFRVRKPTQDKSTHSAIPSHVFSNRRYFFDNPRRYDSDDDLAWSILPQSTSTSLSTDCYDWSSRGGSSSFLVNVVSEERRSSATSSQLNP
ncbi:G protein-coupled receptor 137Ba [Alosa sapidissima]|uniref:G protein-coupled receptor 137Ba n=1 Tax=Alosa sapidissima TaxID=34773 RepID=UPI001C093DDE|nr:G protein-coupled receptor 137Ba [Alosa sapidissima]